MDDFRGAMEYEADDWVQEKPLFPISIWMIQCGLD